MSEPDFQRATLVEGLRFTAQVAVPNLVQGLFRRRRRAVAVATKAGVDGLAVGFMAGLRRRYGDHPVWIRVAKDDALLLLGRESIRRALSESPDPFAADPGPKRKGMCYFQPDAVTISRAPVWQDRRRFNEAVLDTAKPVHRLAGRFAAVAVQEADRLIASTAELDWNGFNAAVRRATRRIVLGDSAAADEQISQQLEQLMDEANNMPGERSERYAHYTANIQSYVEAAQEGSLVSLFEQAPRSEVTKPAGQVTHWLFALGDTLAINAFRCLALLATHSNERAQVMREIEGVELSDGRAVARLEYLDACLEEAMRLWPTTQMLSRETVREVSWNGTKVPAKTQILIVNTFNHRDREEHEFADRFAPEAWISGAAADDWSFNHFSHGPQACPGTGIAKLVGKSMLGRILSEREVRLLAPTIDPGRALPNMLDFFGLRFGL